MAMLLLLALCAAAGQQAAAKMVGSYLGCFNKSQLEQVNGVLIKYKSNINIETVFWGTTRIAVGATLV